jgi:hypothetical protein
MRVGKFVFALHRFHESGAFFVIRAKSNLHARRRYSHPVDRRSGLRSDQTVLFILRHFRERRPNLLEHANQ